MRHAGCALFKAWTWRWIGARRRWRMTLTLLRCHPADYVERLRDAVPASGWAQVDGDTFLSRGRWMPPCGRRAGPVRRGCGAGGRGGQCLCRRRARRGIMPNATRRWGFACSARSPSREARAGSSWPARVAIVDFDVHHGNGTQDLLVERPRAMFCSSHQMPLYPGTGTRPRWGAWADRQRAAAAKAFGTAAMRAAMGPMVLARLEAFEPELILISAGFDAHADDPLAGLRWRERISPG
jgi:acetoin utilization deacetylase AcuC-like enzyme